MKPDIFPEHKPLLSPPDANSKLRHSGTDSHAAWSLSLSPGSSEICPHATSGCRFSCVGMGGLARAFSSISETRELKTDFLLEQPERFLARLESEIRQVISKYRDTELNPLFRLNAFSDIVWELIAPQILTIPGVRCYDYTKNPHRAPLPNYSLTFSRAENNEHHALDWLERGDNVSVVFHEVGNYSSHGAYAQRLPKKWRGFTVIDGDRSDFRCLDPVSKPGDPGYVIGLRLKGGIREREKAIETGFSVPSADWI